MTTTPSNESVVNARVVYWGAEGSGRSTCLQYLHGKLKPDNRGEITTIASPVDADASYEVLPIEIGQIGGHPTRIQIIVVPGSPEFRATRTQLLRDIDGIIFVIDAQRSRMEANLSAFVELRDTLLENGRNIEEIPLVIQHNKRDLADYIALEELHRRLPLSNAPIFEGIATQGTGVLEPLTTVSKQVIRLLRERKAVDCPIVEPAAAQIKPMEQLEHPPADATVIMEAPPLIELETPIDEPQLVDTPNEHLLQSLEKPTPLRILSVGEAELLGEGTLRLPLSLCDPAGNQFELALTLDIGPFIEGKPR